MTTRYQPAIDLDGIDALDMHTHVHASVTEDPAAVNTTGHDGEV